MEPAKEIILNTLSIKKLYFFVISPKKCSLVRLLSHFLSDRIQMYKPNSFQLNELVEM